MAAPTTPKPTDALAELFNMLGEEEKPLSAVVAAVPQDVLARAWAAGDIEFGHTKHVTTGAPHATEGEEVQVVGKTLIIEKGIEWGGPKQKWHGPVKQIIAEAVMPAAKFYQCYRLEAKISRKPDVWQLLKDGEEPGERETRYVRTDVTKEQAAKLFGHFVRLTDKGLSQLQTA